MSAERYKLFISHATPEDNYFAAWLASKLRLLGFSVWCDVDELRGGEDFWNEIETAIRTETAKYLFVLSHHSVVKRGTLKELAVADKLNANGDFILPLRVDDVSFDQLPSEIIRLIAIDFSQNWAEGLAQLLGKLEEDNVPRGATPESETVRELWSKVLSVKSDALLERQEEYRSNWFTCELPSKVRLHRISNPHTIRRFDFDQFPYAAFPEADYIVTFARAACFSGQVAVVETEEVDTLGFISQRFYSLSNSDKKIADPNKACIRLLNESFFKFLKLKRLRIADAKRGILFFSPLTTSAANIRVDLKRYDRAPIQLTGKQIGYRWHLALEGSAFLYPVHAFSITYHIVFTKDGSLVTPNLQHKLRRSYGKRRYNKQWRDLLLGAMVRLLEQDDDGFLAIAVSDDQTLKLSITPVQFVSPIGYREPS